MKLKTYIYSVCKSQKELIFFDRLWHGLWKSDFKLNNIILIDVAGKKEITDGFAPASVFEYGDSYFITSQNSDDIIEYKKDKKLFSRYRNKGKGNIPGDWFYHFSKVNNSIVIIPSRIDMCVTYFDMEKRTYFEGSAISSQKEESYFLYNEDDSLILGEYGGNKIYRQKMLSCKTEKYELDKNAAIECACCAGDIIFAVERNKSLLWKIDHEKISYIRMDETDGDELYGKIINLKNYILAFPKKGNNICRYDITSHAVVLIPLPFEQKDGIVREKSLFYGYYVYENEIYFLPWYLNKLYILNIDTLALSERYLECDSSAKKVLQAVIHENSDFELCDFLDLLK